MKKPSKKDCQSIVKLSYGMSGKMSDVLSLSTNCINCVRCQRRHNNKNTICSMCYAFRQLEKPNYKNTNMIKAFNHNAEVLTKKELDYQSEVKPIAKEIVSACIKNNTNKFRIESFGDLHNEIHAKNYLLICSAIGELDYIYHVNIGFWTKNFDYLIKAFSTLSEDKKANIRKVTNVVLSSVFVDLMISEKVVAKVETILGMKVKTFTVMSKDSDTINCGARHCASCGKCYTKSEDTINIFELLK